MRLDAAHAQGPGPSFPLVPPYLFFLVSVLTQEKTVYDSQLHLKRHSHKEEGGGGVLMKWFMWSQDDEHRCDWSTQGFIRRLRAPTNASLGTSRA